MPFINESTAKPIGEKLKSLSVTTSQGLFHGKHGLRPRNINSFYDWYDNDGAVFAGINSITEMSVGNGFETVLPGNSPTDLSDDFVENKLLVDALNVHLNADELNSNICRNILIAGFCPVETKINKIPTKSKVRIIHPETVKHIELGGNEYHGIKWIIQKVNGKEAKIMGRNLSWFDHNQIANDKTGKSIISPIQTLLATKLNTIDKIDKIDRMVQR